MIGWPQAREEDGSVLVLLLGFAVVTVLLVAVVTDASALYLTRRALAGAADGAALAAVQELDREAFYTGPGQSTLPLDATGAVSAARTYLAMNAIADRFSDFEIVDVDADGESVTVELAARSRLPFLTTLGVDEVVVQAAATARAPYGG